MSFSKVKTPPLSLLDEYTTCIPPKSPRSWGRYIEKLYSSECLVSGVKADVLPMHKHHLFNSKNYPHLMLNVYNGIYLCEEIHKDFHRAYGNNVTPIQFIEYLEHAQKREFKPIERRIDEVINWIDFLNTKIDKDFL